MLSRAYISHNITKLAEDDLLKILCQKEPEPKEFWYSPLILRRVHENLIKEGKTIGLGKLTPKKVIGDIFLKNLGEKRERGKGRKKKEKK